MTNPPEIRRPPKLGETPSSTLPIDELTGVTLTIDAVAQRFLITLSDRWIPTSALQVVEAARGFRWNGSANAWVSDQWQESNYQQWRIKAQRLFEEVNRTIRTEFGAVPGHD